MTAMNNYFKILGFKVRDRVTGFAGVASTVSFDLYGCVQVVVTPEAKDGKRADSEWFDHKRLEKTSTEPVMPVPNFGQAVGDESGPAEKPHRRI